MAVKKVLVEVEEGVWSLLRKQAVDEDRPVKALVQSALRRYLESPDHGSVAAVPSASGVLPVAPNESVATTATRLRELINAVKPGSVQLASEMGSPRAREAERVRRQNHLRSHPEEESQDPRDDEDEGDVGF